MNKFCMQCGSQVAETARFCNKCGTQLLPTQPQTAPPATYQQPTYQAPPDYQQQYQQPGFGQQYQHPYQPPYQPRPAGGELTPNIAGMLSYLFSIVTGVLFLVMPPYNKDRFVRFHAYQSIFFFVGMIILGIVISILGIPLNWRMERTLDNLHSLLWLVGTGFSMFKAYKGEMVKLPFIGDMAETQANKH